MASLSAGTPSPPGRSRHLAKARARYRYRPAGQNQIAPVATAEAWPWFHELYAPDWLVRYAPTWVRAYAWRQLSRLRFRLQRMAFRFDQFQAYGQLFRDGRPEFALSDAPDDAYDAAFGWWRIAGANPLLLTRENDLEALRRRIPLDLEKVEARLSRKLKEKVSLAAEAENNRLFSVDFELFERAFRPRARRDSRWREKYLPAPIGVFLESRLFYLRSSLVPLAIQIDRSGAAAGHNPVHYPDDPDDVWGWRLARTYFEAADVSFQAAAGHLFRAHFLMEPFCLATPRCLSPRHPVRLLLQPHLRFTLPANREAYRHLLDQRLVYAEIYSASLEDLRQLLGAAHASLDFQDLGLAADLARRGVLETPSQYPYRDDLLLWLDPIRDFVSAYVGAFYPNDAAVLADVELQTWSKELSDRAAGSIRQLVPGNRLDGRAKLVGLLAQVLFSAGPGHASLHFSATHFYRYAPIFPAGVYMPPPRDDEPLDFARWLATLPPIGAAGRQFQSNTHTNFVYDRFGSYEFYPLAQVPEAREPIARLRAALAQVECSIRERQRERLFPYEFVLPSRVPNSTNI